VAGWLGGWVAGGLDLRDPYTNREILPYVSYIFYVSYEYYVSYESCVIFEFKEVSPGA
jgi:hypothetical protein